MGKTLHDRVRLKGRYALFNFNRLHIALCASAILALLVVGVQVMY